MPNNKFCLAALLLLLLPLSPSIAQLYTGGNGSLYIRNNTTFVTDGLVLTPSADLTLTNTTITGSSTPVPGLNGASIDAAFETSVPLTFQGTIGQYYTASQLNGNDPSTLQLYYKNSAGNWVPVAGSTVNTSTQFVSATLPAPVQLSGITAASTGTILPVTLMRFTARAEERRVRLDWEMNATETHLCDVQRSADGKAFVTLQQLPLENGHHLYTAYDGQPLNGAGFYRLRWKESNGAEKFSAICNVFFSGKAQQALTLSPQPAKDRLELHTAAAPAAGSYVLLYTADGRLLQRRDVSAAVTSLDLQSYPAGMYLLTFYDGTAASQYKVEKVR